MLSRMATNELRAAMEDDNAITHFHLVRQLRSPLGIIPFVGAGMSVPFGFRSWEGILRQAAAAEGPETLAQIEAHLAAGEFEEAAEELWRRGADSFQLRIESEFNRPLAESQLRGSALGLLTLLATGPVITTNFDHVVESVFACAGAPFAERILGPEPDRILKALQHNSRVLIKMHGDCEDRHARTFTRSEYEKNYGNEVTGLSSLAWLMFTHRPLLFLGCSLDRDRTVKILREIQAKFRGVTHYAVLEAPEAFDRFQARRQELRQMGISPLWFEHGRFAEIKSLLARLLAAVSVRELALARPAEEPARSPTDAAATRVAYRRALVAAAPPVDGAAPDPGLTRHLEHVRRRIDAGRILFFLGSAAHLGALESGDEFYRRLADEFACPETLSDRTAIAEYIIDRHGREQLMEALREHVGQVEIQPSIVLRFIATLPALLRESGRAAVASQWIMTANQDCVLERALYAAGEPFHLLYYQGHGEHEGRFIHIDVDGRVEVIERPQNFRELRDATVVVKINGGLVDRHRGVFTESASLARRDFAGLASLIPEALPAALRSELQHRSLLFLGHGLREPDVENIIRYAAGSDRTLRSWAIQYPAQQVEYWAQCGLGVINADLARYVPELYAMLARPPGG